MGRFAQRKAAFWSANHPGVQPLNVFGHASNEFLSVAYSILDSHVFMKGDVPVPVDRERWLDCFMWEVRQSITDERSALEEDER